MNVTIDLGHLVKLRLAVARFGEMDGAGWWNTQGILGKPGQAVIARGFPATHWFTQARIACAVATARCAAVFAPPGCITLWNLPAEIEDDLSGRWTVWCRGPEEWTAFFQELVPRHSGDLLQHLKELNLIDNATCEATKALRRSAEGKAVPLPGTGKADIPTLMLLAAAFSKGEKQKLAVPYIRAES
jgi:hypothetical protein